MEKTKVNICVNVVFAFCFNVQLKCFWCFVKLKRSQLFDESRAACIKAICVRVCCHNSSWSVCFRCRIFLKFPNAQVKFRLVKTT